MNESQKTSNGFLTSVYASNAAWLVAGFVAGALTIATVIHWDASDAADERRQRLEAWRRNAVLRDDVKTLKASIQILEQRIKIMKGERDEESMDHDGDIIHRLL